MTDLTQYLTTREIATTIWILIILILCVANPSIRKSFLQLIKVLLNRTFIIVFSLMFIYIGLQILALYSLGLWENLLIKELLIWTLGYAIGSIVNINKVKHNDKFFLNLLKESIKLTIFIEFFINFYTFPIIIELIFLPVITFLFMLLAYSETDKKYLPVKASMNALISLVGFMVLCYVLYQFIGYYEGILSWNNLLSFSLPVYLSITFIPFLYLLALFTLYEEIIVMSRYWLREKPHVKKYFVKKLLISNKLSLTSILKFNNIHRKDILKLNSAKDVDELFTEHKSS